MCYSAESSINGFLIGGAASLYLLFFSNNQTFKHIGLFFSSVVLIQLAEYFIWIDQDCSKNYNNLADITIFSTDSMYSTKKKIKKIEFIIKK